jgi:AcrR family transcriptional regulator
MAPRAYALGKRAGTAAETRDKILRAAMASFCSRGTILHHFGSADGLLEAVLDQLLVEMQMPDARIFDGAQTREERVGRFVEAIARLYDRTSDWWRAFEPNLDDSPVLKAREASFWADLYALGREAIGPILDDRVVGLTVWTLLHPWPFGQLRWTGLTIEESIAVLTDQVLHATREREEASPAPDS